MPYIVIWPCSCPCPCLFERSAAHMASSAAADKLVLTGSSTVAPLAAELGKRFEQQHPGTRIDVQSGGSLRGVQDARSGVADVGMVSRALKADEADLQGFVLARDGIAVIVHARNPIQSLTDAQIVAIYTGQLRDWHDVGGRHAPIMANTALAKAPKSLILSPSETTF